jgi:hypothetical protein
MLYWDFFFPGQYSIQVSAPSFLYTGSELMWSILIAGYGAAPLYDYATYSLGLFLCLNLACVLL